MRTSFFAALCGFAAFAHAAVISMSHEEITAGEEVEVRIENATDVGAAHTGMQTTHLQFGIWSSVFNYWMCSVTDFVPAEDGTHKITIPPSMGPSGTFYTIGVWGCTSPTVNTTIAQLTIVPDYTKLFFLSGGTGSFTPVETTPEIKFRGLAADFADIPCENYACAQKCAGEEAPVTSAWQRGSKWLNCLERCEGVKIDYNRVDTLGGPGGSEPPSSVQVPTSLPTPTESCKEEDKRTGCGESCCRSSQFCADLGKNLCALLPDDFESMKSVWESRTASIRSSTTAATVTGAGSATSSGTPPEETGAAVAKEMEWGLLGAAAAVVGVGAGLT